jgi:ribonuclease HI
MAGLAMAVEMHVKAVIIRSDSKLVIGQLTNELEAKGHKMKEYVERAWEM